VNTSRLSFGELIAGIASVLLFIFTFFDWYNVSVNVNGSTFHLPGGQEASEGGSPWDGAISGFWLFLLIVAIVIVVGIVVIRMADAPILAQLPIPPGLLMLIAGGVAFFVVLIKVIFTPDVPTPSFGGVSVDLSREVGLFLALIASAGMAVGGYLALGEGARGGGPGPAAPAGGASAPPPPPPPPPPSGGTPAA
jgi:hypothetical protein